MSVHDMFLRQLQEKTNRSSRVDQSWTSLRWPIMQVLDQEVTTYIYWGPDDQSQEYKGWPSQGQAMTNHRDPSNFVQTQNPEVTSYLDLGRWSAPKLEPSQRSEQWPLLETNHRSHRGLLPLKEEQSLVKGIFNCRNSIREKQKY